MITIKSLIRFVYGSCGLVVTTLFLLSCGGAMYSRTGSGPAMDKNRKSVSVQAPSRDRIDKFNRVYVCCKAREDFKNGGFRPDFRKTYFIQEGKALVNTMFAPLSDTSESLLMIKVVGDQATFPLSVTYMEQTAYMRNIISTLQSYYHFSEDSAVTVIASYNGKRPTKCPMLTMRASEYIAKTLLKNVLDEEGGMGGE
jgi:hypothetical protein